jgi:hypothetical protein
MMVRHYCVKVIWDTSGMGAAKCFGILVDG